MKAAAKYRSARNAGKPNGNMQKGLNAIEFVIKYLLIALI
jgi:hypothetical protein